jgi:lactobin A/cerein 7B family class IIb bacteriocin
MNALTENELNEVTGGITPVAVTVILAISTYVAANWSQIKKGFADGLVDGYNAAQ